MREATAWPPSVVADTTMHTIELGVSITEADRGREDHDDLGHAGEPGSALPGLRARGDTPSSAAIAEMVAESSLTRRNTYRAQRLVVDDLGAANLPRS